MSIALSNTMGSKAEAVRFITTLPAVKYPLEKGPNASTIISTKQIFFSHYFVTGLELSALVRDQHSEEDAFYLLTVIRERTDGVGGMFGRMLKGKAEDAAAKNVEGYLTKTQAAIEKYYRDALARRSQGLSIEARGPVDAASIRAVPSRMN